MRWSSKTSTQYPAPSSQRKAGRWVLSAGYWLLLATVTLLSAAPSTDEKHISVYSPVAIYTLPVLDRGDHEYVGLLELLEPLHRFFPATHSASTAVYRNRQCVPCQ